MIFFITNCSFFVKKHDVLESGITTEEKVSLKLDKQKDLIQRRKITKKNVRVQLQRSDKEKDLKKNFTWFSKTKLMRVLKSNTEGRLIYWPVGEEGETVNINTGVYSVSDNRDTIKYFFKIDINNNEQIKTTGIGYVLPKNHPKICKKLNYGADLKKTDSKNNIYFLPQLYLIHSETSNVSNELSCVLGSHPPSAAVGCSMTNMIIEAKSDPSSAQISIDGNNVRGFYTNGKISVPFCEERKAKLDLIFKSNDDRFCFKSIRPIPAGRRAISCHFEDNI